MKAYQLPVFGLILLMGACKPSDSSDAPVSTDAPDSTSVAVPTSPKQNTAIEPIRHLYRYAKVDRLRLRATPELDGEVLVTLHEGDILEWTGKVSSHKETIELRGKAVTAPWYEVEFIALAYKGWVFGGALTANFPIQLIEDFPKKKVGKGAYKAGPFNLFELADGRPLVLRDNISQTEEYFSMEYHSILEPEGWYQIKGFGYEYHFWLVLNPKNGKITSTIGTLSASPERKWMAAYSGDMIAGFDFNGIQIFQNHGDSLVLKLEQFMDIYEPAGFEWLEETKLQVNRAIPQDDGSLKEESPTFFALTGENWTEKAN